MNDHHETGYGSASFRRACRVAAECNEIEGRGSRAAWQRLRAGSALLLWYRIACRLRPSA